MQGIVVLCKSALKEVYYLTPSLGIITATYLIFRYNTYLLNNSPTDETWFTAH